MSDLIDRQAAVNALNDKYHGMISDESMKIYQIINWLDKLPSVDAPKTNVGKWIPVSSKLPEKPNMYTVTDSNGHVVRFVFTGNESSREYWRRCVKAWMPLPEPYKEE